MEQILAKWIAFAVVSIIAVRLRMTGHILDKFKLNLRAMVSPQKTTQSTHQKRRFMLNFRHYEDRVGATDILQRG